MIRRGNPADRRIPLLGRLIPLISRQIPLLGDVGDFGSESNKINYLESLSSACQEPEQAFLLFFRVEQGNQSARTFAAAVTTPSAIALWRRGRGRRRRRERHGSRALRFRPR